MKGIVATFVTAILGAAGTAGYAGTNSGIGDALLVVGPVESVNSAHTTAIVLGQKVLLGANSSVTVGSTVAVYGKVLGDGSLSVAKLVVEGDYVAGATPVLVSGTVQKVQPSIGRAVVSGITVDLTALMSRGSVTPAVGSTVQISGTQPVNGGVLVADGITGGGLSANGITGGGLSANGITGGGLSANGITGGGLTASGITGGGMSADGITGGGLKAAGITGGGLKAAGITGGGLKADGITGGGL